MITIEKSSDGVVTEIIEGENYSINMYAKPTVEQMQFLVKLINLCNTSVSYDSVSNTSRMQEVLNLSFPSLIKTFKSGAIIFTNTENDLMYDIIPPISPASGDNLQGIVGAVDLDWIGYSGSDTKRGTLNLNESYIKNTNKRYRLHLVVDFPTHSCNGSVNKISFLPYSCYSQHIIESHRNFKNNRFVPRIEDIMGKIELREVESLSYISHTITTDNKLAFKQAAYSDNSSIIKIMYDGISKMVSGSDLGLEESLSSAYRVVSIGEKLYLYNSYTTSVQELYRQWLQEIIVTKDEENFTLQCSLGERSAILDVVKIPGASAYSELLIKHMYSIGNYLYLNIEDRWDDYYFYILDSDQNVIYQESNYSCPSTITFKNGEHTFYGMQNKLFDATFNLIGTLPMAHSDSRVLRYFTNGEVNYMMAHGYEGLMCHLNTFRVAEIDLFQHATTFKPTFEILLSEPLVKNNSETLKLIFDFDITIE